MSGLPKKRERQGFEMRPLNPPALDVVSLAQIWSQAEVQSKAPGLMIPAAFGKALNLSKQQYLFHKAIKRIEGNM